MKTLIKSLGILLLGSLYFHTASAQSAQDKQAALIDAVNNRDFVFVADYVGGHSLTGSYDVTISKDSVITSLPYFGSAVVSNYGSIDDGIKLTTTNFKYTQTAKKPGMVDIVIIPKTQNLNSALSVKAMRLTVSANGYASLEITSFNRSPIMFGGYVRERNVKGI
jgi:hypothetical protein